MIDITEALNRYKWKKHFQGLKQEIMLGNIPEPRRLTIELTMRCNLKCQMCFRDQDVKNELTFDELKEIIKSLPTSIKEINLIGGEIFLRKDIFEILDLLEAEGYSFRIHSNGTLLNDEKINRLSNYKNLRGIGFSIDGNKELHNKIRGSPTAYDKTIESIKKTAKLMPVSVNTVILDENFKEITEIFKVIRELGIKEYRVEPEMFSTPKEAKASKPRPIAANIKENGAYSFTSEDIKKLRKDLDNLAKEKDINVVIAPRVAEIDSKEFIDGTIREKKTLFCKHLLVPRIDSEGNLISCHILKKEFGTLLEKPFNELWVGEEFKRFRAKLLSENLLPACIRCCRLRSI